MTNEQLNALAAAALILLNDEDTEFTEACEDAQCAFIEACEAAGYDWENDQEAHDFAYVGAKATGAEMIEFLLPRAIAALNG